MISKRGKKIFVVVIVIATAALLLGAMLPYLLYAQ
jgi:hypothetical protein